MRRIELKYCTPVFKDGLAGTAVANEQAAADALDLDITTVVLNTTATDKVPVGARFTVAGETLPTVHVVTARTQDEQLEVVAANAKQSVGLDAVHPPTGGTFTLAHGGTTTAPVAYDADAATVKAALVAMDDGYAAADWDVTGVAGAWVVEFKVAQGNRPQVLLVGNGASLTGAGDVVKTVYVATTQLGVVHVAAIATDSTVNIVFAPALGAGSYAGSAVLTFQAQELEVSIGDGDLKYSENSQYKYDLDRGRLDTVRDGDEVPMDVNMNFTWSYTKSGTGEPIAPIEAIKGIGAAVEWVSTGDACEPYAVDLEVRNVPKCAASYKETYLFPAFRAEKRDHDFKNANVAVNGKCNATEPVITRG